MTLTVSKRRKGVSNLSLSSIRFSNRTWTCPKLAWELLDLEEVPPNPAKRTTSPSSTTTRLEKTFNLIFYRCFLSPGAGDGWIWTPKLGITGQLLYHWATTGSLNYNCLKVSKLLSKFVDRTGNIIRGQLVLYLKVNGNVFAWSSLVPQTKINKLLGSYSQHFIFFITYEWAQFANLFVLASLPSLV